MIVRLCFNDVGERRPTEAGRQKRKIMKKQLFIAAATLIAFAGCTDETFVGEKSLQEANGGGAISFNFDVPMSTRAEGAAAATKLNSQFIVWGEKNEAQETTDPEPVPASGTAPATGNLVFPNYKVTYGANTAYTTTSNTKDWEYVGLSYGDEKANIKYNSTAVTSDVQTIKFWDYAANSYTFTAVSALPTDISDGKVTINKITTATGTDQTIYDKGYQVTVTDMADLNSLYFADRINIAKTADKDRTAANKYGGNVKFTFRNGLSQVRVAMYETIPGYDVKITKFSYKDAENADQNSTTNFVANVPNVSPASGKTSVAGTFAVTYYEKNSTNDAASISNHPKISFTPTNSADSKVFITLGDQIAAATKLGETSATATFDKTDGADADSDPDFTTVFPQEDNNTNLKLTIDYQLKNTVTGETINITGKTAEVPAQYLQWKPNYKYTYIFKINDNELYPITFDAVTVEAENGNVEYITTVSEPSITTYVKGSNVTTNNEYAASEKVYAVVEDGHSLATLSASNMKLYTVTTSDATNFPITEASIAEAIAEYPCLNTAEQTAAKIKFTESSFNYGKTIIAEDGSTVTMDASNNVVADFTTATGTVYAIQYIKTAVTYTTDGGKNNYDASTYAAAGTLYTDAACTTEATGFTSGTTYYKRTGVTNVGTYAYKIVRVGGATGQQ